MNDKYDCEMVKNNLCSGCVGLAEQNWIGKYKCSYYWELVRKIKKIRRKENE